MEVRKIIILSSSLSGYRENMGHPSLKIFLLYFLFGITLKFPGSPYKVRMVEMSHSKA